MNVGHRFVSLVDLPWVTLGTSIGFTRWSTLGYP